MFGQGMFGGAWFASFQDEGEPPPPTPTPTFGAGGDARHHSLDRRDRIDDDDDVAMITALFDL